MFSRLYLVLFCLFGVYGCDNSKQVADKIVIFSKATCFYCKKAKLFFQKKKLSFKEIHFNKNSEKDLALLNSYAIKSKAQIGPIITVPQIFIGKHYVGGFSDLRELSDKDLQVLLDS